MNLRILFSIIIIILSTHLLKAQVAFPTLDAHWCYDGYTELSFDPWPYCISPSELVELNGKTYSKINYFPHPNESIEQEILYRGEDRKFYVIPQDSTEEILIYDFDLEVGDTFVATWGWQIWGAEVLEVWNTDTIITADGVARKRISLQSNSSSGTWVEGIGSENWIFVYPSYTRWLEAGYDFTCHFQGGEPIHSLWSNAEFCDLDALTNTSEIKLGLDFYPNPVNNILNISTSEINIEKIKIIDLSGNTVYQKKINAQNFHLETESILKSGVYLLQAYGSDGSRITKKFIKL